MTPDGKILSLEEQLFVAKQEAKRWKDIALYFLDCHAATAGYDGQLKSVAKSRKLRFASILEKGISLVEGKEMPRTEPGAWDGHNPQDRVLKRCQNAIDEIRGTKVDA